jgi:hypothetical protein
MRLSSSREIHMNRCAAITAALSTILLGLVLILWFESTEITEAFERPDLLNPYDPQPSLGLMRALGAIERRRTIISCRGSVAWTEEQYERSRPGSVPVAYNEWTHTSAEGIDINSLLGPPSFLHGLGFAFRAQEVPRPSPAGSARAPCLVIAIPHWFLAVCFAVAPTAYIVRRVRTYRRASGGLCLACGYDLRASTTRCPECGEPIS